MEKTTITLAEAYQMLESADAVMVNGEYLAYPMLSSLQFDDGGELSSIYDDNQFMYLSSRDGEFATKFEQGNNQTVLCDSHTLFLNDFEGDVIELWLLKITELKTL